MKNTQIRKNGLGYTRLPIRFKVQENNSELSSFIFNLFGSGFYAAVFGSTPHLTPEDIQAAGEYHRELALLSGIDSAFSSDYFPEYEVIERMPSGGDLLQIKNEQSLSFFLSTGDSESSVSFFSDDFKKKDLVTFLEGFSAARSERLERDQGYLFIEEYISTAFVSVFKRTIALIDTLYSDEDDSNYLLVSSDQITDIDDLSILISETTWPIELAGAIRQGVE